MTPAATVAGEQFTATQHILIQALRDYAAAYGDDFTTAAFNPSTAKWRDDPISRDRYLAGNPRTGEPWPSLNMIKSHFGGSFNAARVAAGFEPNRAGPGRGKRKAHRHAPIRGVDDRERQLARRRARMAERRAEAMAEREGRTADAAVTRAARKLESKLEGLERRLVKANERLRGARERARAADLAMRKQRDRADRNAELVATLRAELRDVGAGMGAALSRAERAETTAGAVAAERDRAVQRLEADLARTREELVHAAIQADRDAELRELADPGELEAARAEVHAARERVAAAREAQGVAERAQAEAVRARRAAERAAELAQADARRELAARVELQRSLVGHDRPLTVADRQQLISKGPAGSAVFAAAVKAVAKANARGGREPLKLALRDAAAAALRWSERL